MIDDKKPRPDYEAEPLPTPKKISDLYDAGKAVRTCHFVFPRDTADTLHALTGVPMRSVTRWLKGEQRIPPTLLDKLGKQRDLKREFVGELESVLQRFSDAGMLHEAMRQAVIVEIGKDFFKNTEEL